MIILKTDSEIEIMKQAGEIVALTFEMLKEHIKPGVSTKHLDELVEKFIKKCKATPSFLGYNGYPASACISKNEVIVHGIPKSDDYLKEGDIVSIDIGAYYKGFHADAARTYPVGRISPEANRLIEVTKQSFFEGLKFAYEGFRIGDISSSIQEYVEKNGFSVVRSLVGHGVGKNLHEAPDVPNFGTKGRGPRLKNGMVIAIEPMVNEGTYDCYTLPDGWTTVTRDKKLSAHYENTVAITKDGPRLLTMLDNEVT
ncbi:MAG: type I methionyl aminopeptidase [Clostridiaceae bacterium]|nr:type I methionyl aminopeptidase [Clostridiaceae bacterium]